MKNIIKFLLTLLIIASVNSCTDADNIVDEVVNGTESGAVLRTIEILNNTLNSSIPTTAFSVTIEEQDDQGGALLQSVDVYVSIRDLTSSNGTTVAEGLVKTIDASQFTPGPHGLPRATISATFAEAESGMGLSPNQTEPGDLYIFELRVNLTDGRTFGGADAAGIITGGYWSSPYLYNTLIVCSPEPGDYKLDMIDNYGDGWQGDAIRVNIDGVETDYTLPSYWDEDPATRGSVGDPQWVFGSITVNVPVGAELATWEYISGSFPGEVEFEIFAPNGTSFGYFGPAAAPGLLPVLQCAGM